MARSKLTDRQELVLKLRYDCGASVEQIGKWLGISRRAVLYRLDSAERRLPERTEAKPAAPWKPPRVYAASQLGLGKGGLKLDRI